MTAQALLHQRWSVVPQARAGYVSVIPESLAIVIALLLPLTRLITFELVGVLYLFDILTPLLLGLLLTQRGWIQALRPLRVVLILLAIWFGGQLVTDVYRATPTNDLLRGWSKIGLLGINLMAIWLLSAGRRKVFAAWAIGIGGSVALSPYWAPTTVLSVSEPWKFGVGYGLAMAGSAAFMLVGSRRTLWRYPQIAVLIVVGAISLYLNTRWLFAVCILAAVYSALAMSVGNRPRLARAINPTMFLAIVIVGALAGQLLLMVYSNAAEAGILGQEARVKYLVQSGAGNLIIGGRLETFVSIEAIKDSPILGHGSWAKDPLYTRLLFEQLVALRLPYWSDYLSLGRNTGFTIPSHSHLLGAWVEAGVLGALTWVGVLLITFRGLYTALKVPSAVVAPATLAAFSMLWDILFSPFAADGRIVKALEIALVIYMIQLARSWRQATESALAQPPHEAIESPSTPMRRPR